MVPAKGPKHQDSKKRRMGSGNELEEGVGTLYLGQLCHTVMRALSLVWWQVSFCQIYGEGSSVVIWTHILRMRDRRWTTKCYH